jgi:3'-5' exoribonuclease
MEAVILNFLDDLDSKINGVRTHIEKEPDSESPWTAYHRLYDRYFFKNSVPERKEKESAPPPSPSPPVRPAAKKPVEKDRKKPFGFTLGDQLKGKSLDLFAVDEEE